MGWVALFVVVVAAFAALVLLGLRRPLWSMAGAAVMLGAAGYALQGAPLVPAAPARPAKALPAGDDAALNALRDAMLGRFSGDGAYVTAADAMTRDGDRKSAVRAVLGGIAKVPESVLLWTELGNTLVAHDGGRLSPPALFAFRQAARLSPRHPAPPFFLGIAYVRAGDFPAARRQWRRALALTPAGASYRPEIAGRLALIERLLDAEDAER